MANWEKIREDYMLHDGEVKLKDFAKKHKVKYSTLRSRKNRENWDKDIVATKNATKQKNVATPKIEAVKKLDEADLTEKQRLFCLYYVKTFNATQSAIKAGYSKDTAHVIGHENLRKPNIATEIRRLKGTMQEDLFIDAIDVLRKYVEIAFADITDFVTFGQKEVPVMSMFGPVKDGEGNTITKMVNYIDLKESSEVDGTILSEVSQSKDGIKVKPLDRMKALEKLELYFDLLPDKWKRKIEEEKLKLAAKKAGEEGGDVTDDGFIEALKGEVSEVWSDED